MIQVKRVVLDVLKPHHPDALEFASMLAEQAPGYNVTLSVVEMDENTETVNLVIEGDHVELKEVTEAVGKLGGSVHSVDEVNVVNQDLSQ